MLSVLNLKSGKTGEYLGEAIYKDTRLKKGAREVYVVMPEGGNRRSYWNKDACIVSQGASNSKVRLFPV